MKPISKLHRLIQKIGENLFPIFQVGFIILLGLLAVVFLTLMFSKNPQWIINLFGMADKVGQKFEALKFVGIGMAGCW